MRVIFNDGERVLDAEVGMPLLFSAMRERIFIPSACGGRASCGQCRVRVLSGAPPHTPEERSLLGPEEMARGIHLACQMRVGAEMRMGPETCAGAEMRVQLPSGYLQARQYSCAVSEIREPAPGMREVDLDLLEPAGMSFLAGQYVQFLRPGTERDEVPVYRAYSVASSPSRRGRLTLLFARVPEGACTSYVFEHLKVGERLTINGPFGSFHLGESDLPLVFVAGGSGIAPVRSILMDMAERGVRRTADFFFSARTADDLVYARDMRALEARLPGFRFVPVLTRPRPDEAWTGETGGLPWVLSRMLPPLDRHEAYLCGPPGLIDASINAMKTRGLRAERVFFDKFS